MLTGNDQMLGDRKELRVQSWCCGTRVHKDLSYCGTFDQLLVRLVTT
jgi:hypothetical protein